MRCGDAKSWLSVEKARNRQNRKTISGSLIFVVRINIKAIFRTFSRFGKMICNDFDLLRNSRLTVPMYADRRELLVFRTFSTVSQRVEKVFRHAEEVRRPGALLIFHGTTAARTR